MSLLINGLRVLSLVYVLLVSASQTHSAIPQFSRFSSHSDAKPLEKLTFRTAEGSEEKLENFKGNVCLLVFWATWCAHCLPEMKDFDHLAETLQESGLRILALSHDTKSGKVEDFYRQQKINNLPVYYDPDMQAAMSLGIRGIPTAILIDKQGREVGRLEGAAAWGSQEAKNLLNYYLTLS